MAEPPKWNLVELLRLTSLELLHTDPAELSKTTYDWIGSLLEKTGIDPPDMLAGFLKIPDPKASPKEWAAFFDSQRDYVKKYVKGAAAFPAMLVALARMVTDGPLSVWSDLYKYNVQADHPIILPPPAALVQGLIRVQGMGEVNRERFTEHYESAMRYQGIGEWTQWVLDEVGRPVLTPVEAWTLWRRKEDFGDDAYKRFLRRAGIREGEEAYVDVINRQELSPDYLFREFVRGKLSQAEGVKRFKRLGFSESTAIGYLDLSHLMADPATIIRGLHRGFYGPATTVERLERLGYYTSDAQTILKAAWDTLPRGDLDRFLFAGKITTGDYAQRLSHLGLRPDHADLVADWPWTPTPMDVAGELLSHGTITEAEFADRLKAHGVYPPDAQGFARVFWRTPDMGTLRRLLLHGQIPQEGFETGLQENRLRGDYRQGVTRSLYDPLGLGELQALYRRGEITKAEYANEARKHGIGPRNFERLEKLRWIVPPPSDVITMAVRDVFEEDVVEHFGYEAEFPPKFVEWAAKTGISPEVAKLYWYMHWQLPGLGTVFDMFHRVKPGQDHIPREQRETWVLDADIDMFMKTVDYPLWWRDRLKAVSYRPIMRVDIRRVYRAGLASEEDVYNTNRALGYTHENAEKLTEWIKETYTPDSIVLLRDRVLDAYREGGIEADEARSILINTCGFRPITVQFYMDAALYDRAVKRKELTLAQIKGMLLEGLITLENARDRMARLNWAATEIDLFLADWQLDLEAVLGRAAKRDKRPTESQMRGFLKTSVIIETEYNREMAEYGYSAYYIRLFTQQTLKTVSADELMDRAARGRLIDMTVLDLLLLQGEDPYTAWSTLIQMYAGLPRPTLVAYRREGLLSRPVYDLVVEPLEPETT